MSDRDVNEVTPELWLRDLEAVVDALKLDRFALLGMSQGGPAAIRYAVKHPERVTHLILYGSYARGRRHRDEEESTTAMEEAMCALIRSGWGSDNDTYRELFSARFVSRSNREHIGWLNELEAISATPAMAERYFRALGTIDVSDMLPKVTVPTLVLHCQGDRATPIRYGREIAAGIAGARFVPMEGDNHVFLESDAAYRTFFEEVQAFLGDKRQLVDKRALRRGARNWRALVSHVHHAVEPYYVIAAVASLLAGSFSFVWARLH
jgi:pimeloyl-ACP methyl ester carboxylesterase